MDADGRYAPSPSGPLHLGNLRTALLAWLASRAEGGRFALRVDDLDAQRSRPEIAEQQLRDLAELGLDHDGPVLWQSKRLDRYDEAFRALQAAGALYPCYCTRAEIREAVRAPHGVEGLVYPGTCRELSATARAAHEAAGRRPAWRLRSSGAQITFEDGVLGEQRQHAEDVVLRRADGAFGYQLAVVVDDADQGVGLVVRGADLLPSVAAQREIGQLLGLSAPRYAHMPLMLGPDGERLAKRHGASSLSEVLAGACPFSLPGLPAHTPTTPAGLRSALAATVGLVPPGEELGLAELLQSFSTEQLPRESTMMQP